MSATACWAVVALCAAATFTAKGVGPAAAGSGELPERAARVVALLAPALLAALIVTQAVADGTNLRLGADTAGVALAGVLLWRRARLVLVVLAAALLTAGLRWCAVQ